MPNNGSHLSGPVRHTTRLRSQSERAWFRELPIGMNDPDFVHQFVDFVNVTDYSTTDYTLGSSGTGTSAAVNTSSSAANGALQLQTGSTAGNYASVQNKALAWLLDRTLVANTHANQSHKRLWFEAQFTADVAFNDVDTFVGLSETQANIVGLSQNFVGFRVQNGSALLRYQSSTAGVTTSQTVSAGSANSVSLVPGQMVRVGFMFDNANNVDFYINRNFMGRVGSAAIPSSPLALSVMIATSSSAQSRGLTLDYMYACKTR